MRSARLSLSAAGLRRQATTFMPKAFANIAVLCAMLPQPTKPMVLPFKTPILKLSHFFACLFACDRGTCLLKCSAAAIAYSASESENAPRPLVSETASERASSKNGRKLSTPAENEWTHSIDEYAPQSDDTSAAATPGAQTTAVGGAPASCACTSWNDAPTKKSALSSTCAGGGHAPCWTPPFRSTATRTREPMFALKRRVRTIATPIAIATAGMS
mmetsp:Transcript_27608/g.92744  ORF Transcript_27608/g.92744 Transcript_27608/m.92744 type:complete len:216 (-) Transcript_27608:2-649(-)